MSRTDLSGGQIWQLKRKVKKYVCASKALLPDLVPLFLQWPGLWGGWAGSKWDAVLTVGPLPTLPTASSSLCWCPFDPSASQGGRTEMLRRRKGTGWPLDIVSPAGVQFYCVRAVPLPMLQWQSLGFIWCCCNHPKCFLWGAIVARCVSWLVRWSCKTGLKIFPTPSSLQWLLLWLKYVVERMGKCLRWWCPAQACRSGWRDPKGTADSCSVFSAGFCPGKCISSGNCFASGCAKRVSR